MENRFWRILLNGVAMFIVGLLLFLPVASNAADVLKPQQSPLIQPEVKRSGFKEENIDTENFELGFYRSEEHTSELQSH